MHRSPSPRGPRSIAIAAPADPAHPFAVATLLAMVFAAVLASTAMLSAQRSDRDATSRSAADRSLPGIAVAERQVLLSTPVEGVLAQIAVREGQLVAAGEVLATLDDRVARAAVDAARAQFESEADIAYAEAELTLADEKFARLAQAGSAVNALTLAEARARRDQARSAVESARQARRLAELNLRLETARLDRLTIRAPFAGRVTRIHADEGATLTTSHELLQLVSLQSLRADVPVPIAMHGRLTVGARYALRAGAPVNTTLIGALRFVDPVLDPASGTFRCVFAIANAEEKLPAGFAVRLESFEPVPDAQPAPPAGTGR